MTQVARLNVAQQEKQLLIASICYYDCLLEFSLFFSQYITPPRPKSNKKIHASYMKEGEESEPSSNLTARFT